MGSAQDGINPEMDLERIIWKATQSRKAFFKLSLDAVNELNRQRNDNRLSFAYKAMVPTGMALNVTGRWEESQLFPRFQQIFAKYRSHFDGEIVPRS